MDLICAISKRTELSLCFEPGYVLAHRLRCLLAHLAENMSLVGRVECYNKILVQSIDGLGEYILFPVLVYGKLQTCHHVLHSFSCEMQ